MSSALRRIVVLCAGHEQHGRCTPSALCAAVPARLLSQPTVLSYEMPKGFQCSTPSHHGVTAGITAGVTAGIEEGIDYRVVGGIVEQQCNPDPFSVSVHECLPPAASKDGETL
jgi:hypothetical protein